MKCGLLGRKLGHSYSPQIHSMLAQYPYALYEKEPEDLKEFLSNGDFTGLNVTMPYKKAVIPFCNELSERAVQLGAVNTLIRTEDGRLVGHNTDYFGFRALLDRSGLFVSGKKVLVLGSGGASNTAVAVLAELGAQVVVISRTGVNNYSNLILHADASVIVNATPVGMYPNNGVSPVDLDVFPNLEGVLDVVYNPARTALLMQAEKRGLIALGGLWMLVAQAKESAEWFSGSKIPDSKIHEIYHLLKKQTENIILIGMPGCGKTTIGREIASRLARPFVDIDTAIEESAGMTIPEIFSKQGEAFFREAETAAIGAVAKESGLVIATGGGCVTKDVNYPLLHQNGRIVWLQRDLVSLPVSGRPLSQSQDLHSMYITRRPLYTQFADYIVSNQGSIDETVRNILNLEV